MTTYLQSFKSIDKEKNDYVKIKKLLEGRKQAEAQLEKFPQLKEVILNMYDQRISKFNDQYKP